MRIGLFGGTFDPVHLGHLRAAVEVREGFGLDKIVLIPSALPPHKKTEGIVDARHRLAMIREAVAGKPQWEVSDVELNRSGPSYTIDTLAHFQSVLPEGTRLFFVAGLDAFLEIESWKSYRQLFEITPIIVITRPTGKKQPAADIVEKLTTHLHTHVSRAYCYSPEKRRWTHPRSYPVIPFNVTLMDISSSQVRQLLRTGRSIQFLVPRKVATYIREQGLYR